MFLILCILFSLIFSCTPVVATQTSSNTPITMSSSINSTTDNLSDGFNKLSLNNISNYLGLEDATHFAITDDYLYYSTNTNIYRYGFEENKSIEILVLSGVNKLYYSNGILYAYASNSIQKISNPETIASKTTLFSNCDFASFYTSGNSTYISYLNGNTLYVYEITTINQNGVEIMNYTFGSTFSPVSISNNNLNTYIYTDMTGFKQFITVTHSNQSLVHEDIYDIETAHLMYVKDITINDESTPLFYDYDIGYMYSIINNEYTSTQKFSTTGENGFVESKFYRAKDCYIYNGKLYVLDSIYNAIQQYDFIFDEIRDVKTISFERLIVASNGYTAGRFYNPQSFDVLNKDTFIVADTDNKSVQIIEDTTSTIYSTYKNNNEDKKFKYPIKFLSTNTNYVVLQKYLDIDEFNYQILILDKDFNLTKEISHNLTNITDIEMDLKGNIYISDSVTNKIYKYSGNELEELVSPLQITTLSTNARLTYMAEANILAVLNDSVVYLLYLTSNTKTSITLSSIAISITTDYYKNIYVLTENNIYRYLYNQSYSSGVGIALFNTTGLYNNIVLEKETGHIYLFDQINQQFVIYKSTFTYDLITEFTNPINIVNYSSTNIIDVGKTKLNTYVSTYPFKNGVNYNIENQNVYILDSTTYSNYYFIAYNNNSTDTFEAVQVGYVAKEDVEYNTISGTGTTQTYKVITDTKIYRLPTLLKYNNQSMIIKDVENGIAEDKILTVGTTLTTNYVAITETNFSIDNCSFYAIILSDNSIGYVKEYDVVANDVIVTEEILQTNAKITVAEDRYNSVFIYTGSSKIVTGKLVVGTRIFVENYNINEKYTYIKYLDSFNHEHSGYILTNTIKLDADKNTNIAAIILITCSILAVLGISTFYIISKKRQHKLNAEEVDYTIE